MGKIHKVLVKKSKLVEGEKTLKKSEGGQHKFKEIEHLLSTFTKAQVQ
jgi:hypothetical protein